MPKATLLKPASLTIHGDKFVRGVPREVPAFLAAKLAEDERFKVTGLQGVIADAAPKVPERSRGDILIAIRSAADRLTEDTDFTSDGKPDCRALSRILGFTVTIKDRDEALAKADPEEDLPDLEEIVEGAGEGTETSAPVEGVSDPAPKAKPIVGKPTSREDRAKLKEKARKMVVKKPVKVVPADEGDEAVEEEDPTTAEPLEV